MAVTTEERLSSLEQKAANMEERLADLEEYTEETTYNSAHSGVEIDEAVTQVQDNADSWGAGGKMKYASLTLSKDGWDSTEKTQTLTNDIFVANSKYVYFVGPEADYLSAYGESDVSADNITVDTKITFRCSEIPENDIVVMVSRQEVEA